MYLSIENIVIINKYVVCVYNHIIINIHSSNSTNFIPYQLSNKCHISNSFISYFLMKFINNFFLFIRIFYFIHVSKKKLYGPAFFRILFFNVLPTRFLKTRAIFQKTRTNSRYKSKLPKDYRKLKKIEQTSKKLD